MDQRLFFLVFLCFLIRSSHGRELGLKLTTGISSGILDPTRVTQISRTPRAYLYTGFLTDKECDHLIFLAKDKLEKSMVADNDSGKSVESEVRTSSGMFLNKAQELQCPKFGRANPKTIISFVVKGNPKKTETYAFNDNDEIVRNIESRVAAWTFLPEENAEAMQILHYEHGQKYEPHFDYFSDKYNIEYGGHRTATVLMYLSDVKKGGETVFPMSKAYGKQMKAEDWSDCAKQGNAVKPRKGDALLFFSLHPNATTDPSSLHGSCPVIEGKKWSATKWIHVQSYDKSWSDGGECVDKNSNCQTWALRGECKKNPNYMVGTKGDWGFCRKSCKACSS